MRKTALSVLMVMMLVLVCAFAAWAEEAVSEDAKAEGDFDFLAFAKERVLPDFHPTVKLEDAQADFDEKPYDKGDGITRARVGIYYKGWIRQHSMLVEMDYRAEDRKIRVNVLKDTNGTNLVGARFFKDGEWVSIAAMGWK
ncbi:MAG: hypothetical protein IJU07_08475 [Synergistaceae bacterium]|nr:hypothetical protein [Synergistaceae bacterium]